MHAHYFLAGSKLIEHPYSGVGKAEFYVPAIALICLCCSICASFDLSIIILGVNGIWRSNASFVHNVMGCIVCFGWINLLS